MHAVDRIRAFIDRHDLARGDTRVVIALSGGSDSVALTYLLRELDAAGRLRVAGVAHFNHQLRTAAETDERFSIALAESVGLPIRVEREDVAAARAAIGIRSSTPHGPRGTHFTIVRASRSAPMWWRSVIRATIRPRPFCCVSCAAPDRADWRRCTPKTARSFVRS